ncbi:MAG TPA: type IV toxin-antitoxin system AbiEi family antitoxin domain-containing protein [Baekduia sp.]|nr:type IV toxin-antitoxin system AbiEi family antitoxin domain-containing protein [Baekduia sp.]
MSSVGDISRHIGDKRRPSVADLATRQHGIVRRSQLIALGWTTHQVNAAIARRELIAIHRGVYAVGHSAVGFEGRLVAAIFAGGSGSAISHFAAAALWGIAEPRGQIEISVPRNRRWNPSTVVVHRPHRLVEDIAQRNGIAVTTVARTIMDLAPLCPIQELRRMLHEAEVARLTDRVDVYERLMLTPAARGARRLKRVLATNAAPSKHELERRFHQLIAGKGIHAPRRNSVVEIRGEIFEVDAWWPEHRLVVELDGFAVHGTRTKFESDRRRDELFLTEGIHVVRVTWLRVTRDSADLVRSLRTLLSTPGRH